MADWKCALQLNSARELLDGSEEALADAIRNGADLRVYTEFRHNEHVDTSSDRTEMVREVAEFAVTYLIDDSWSAAAMTLRQPISLPEGFGQRSSMSYFLYNQNGQQAIARPYLDGGPVTGSIGPAPQEEHSSMPKMHANDSWDAGTNAPSSNFIYDFDTYRFNVLDNWRELLSHDAEGNVLSGSVVALGDAFAEGRAVKVSLSDFCSELSEQDSTSLSNELFVNVGSCYYYTEEKLFIGGTHPMVRIAPGKPMLYRSRNWDSGWLMVRTDGHTVYRRCDPYTLAFEDREAAYAARWFVR